MAGRRTGKLNDYFWFLKASHKGHEGKWVAIKGRRVVEEGTTAEILANKIKDRVDLNNLMLAKIPQRNQVMVL